MIYRLYYVEKGQKHYLHCSEMCESIEEFIDYCMTILDPQDFADDEGEYNNELYAKIMQKLSQNIYDVSLHNELDDDCTDIIIRV